MPFKPFEMSCTLCDHIIVILSLKSVINYDAIYRDKDVQKQAVSSGLCITESTVSSFKLIFGVYDEEEKMKKHSYLFSENSRDFHYN